MRWKHIELFQVKSTVPWSAAHKDMSLDLVYPINPCSWRHTPSGLTLVSLHNINLEMTRGHRLAAL